MVGSGFDIIPTKGPPGRARRRAAVALSLALVLAITLVVAAPLLIAS